MNITAAERGGKTRELRPFYDAARIFSVPAGPMQASFRGEPTARIAESLKNCQNHPAVAGTGKGRSYGESRFGMRSLAQ